MHILVLLFFKKQEMALPMSSDVAIKVENLSKCYQIYERPQDRLKQAIYPRLQRFVKNQPKQYYREFWALKDISFEVNKGETVGIIGQNGSGKSTLLQIICGTLNPTSGSMHTNGRIAALLELGSGFNPEFTGRENVYMNSAILGLSQSEIESRLDDILGFADIGDFVDQPVKTYSSGMFVRLAFAVNILSDPEIMVVDEALAVGDMRFQAKCITALKRIQENGATILFVSHDIGSVKSLCSRGIYLQNGQLKAIGRSGEIAERYIRDMREEISTGFKNINPEDEKRSADKLTKPTSADIKSKGKFTLAEEDQFARRINDYRYGSGEVKVRYAQFLDIDDVNIIEADFNQLIFLKIYFESTVDDIIAPSYQILDNKKNEILGASPRVLGLPLVNVKNGRNYVATYSTRLPLQEGLYSITLYITKPKIKDETAEFFDVIENAFVFKVARRECGRIWTKVFVPNTLEIINL